MVRASSYSQRLAFVVTCTNEFSQHRAVTNKFQNQKFVPFSFGYSGVLQSFRDIFILQIATRKRGTVVENRELENE